MGIRGEIHSEKYEVSSGRRIYFFNVKEDRRGNMFLTLVESVTKSDGRVGRQQVVVYEEDLDDFRYALNKAITVMNKEKSKKPKKPERPKKSYRTKQ